MRTGSDSTKQEERERERATQSAVLTRKRGGWGDNAARRTFLLNLQQTALNYNNNDNNNWGCQGGALRKSQANKHKSWWQNFLIKKINEYFFHDSILTLWQPPLPFPFLLFLFCLACSLHFLSGASLWPTILMSINRLLLLSTAVRRAQREKGRQREGWESVDET